jgi:hypothetical protein
MCGHIGEQRTQYSTELFTVRSVLAAGIGAAISSSSSARDCSGVRAPKFIRDEQLYCGDVADVRQTMKLGVQFIHPAISGKGTTQM